MEIISHILEDVKFLIFFFWQKPKMTRLSVNIWKNTRETFNWNTAWRKVMKLIGVCGTNEKTVDGSGLFLQALVNHENDRKLVFLKEQQL